MSRRLCAAAGILATFTLVLAAPSLPDNRSVPSTAVDKDDSSFRTSDVPEEYPAITPFAKRPQLPAADTFAPYPFRDAVPTTSMNDDGTAVVGASEPNVDYVETYAPVETRTQPRDAFVMKSIPQVQFMPPPEDKTAPKDTVDLKFLPPADSVVPKFTGSFVKAPEDKAIGFEWDVRGPITNPASFYLQGASIENVKPPTCRMIGCDGPVPNDSDIFLQTDANLRANNACHQTFVPLNSCVDGRGYPVGMICTICCDCTADFKAEMVKSRGYIQGYQQKK